MSNVHTAESFHSKSIDNAYDRLMLIESEVFEDIEFLVRLGGKIITSMINSLQGAYHYVSSLWAEKTVIRSIWFNS